MDQALKFEDLRSHRRGCFFKLVSVHARTLLMDHTTFPGVLVVLGAVFTRDKETILKWLLERSKASARDDDRENEEALRRFCQCPI